MRNVGSFCIVLIATLVSLQGVPVAAAEDVLCVKKLVKPNKRNRVPLGRSMTVRQDSCLRNEVSVMTGFDATSLLTKLQTVDGASSGLDADTIDGIDSSDLASASSVTALSSTVTSQGTSIQTNETNISSLTSSLSSVSDNIESLGLGPRLVRVGTTGSQYTDLAAAISYVNSQTRSDTNRWLIKVGPGTFELDSQVEIPQYVELQGSGEDVTVVVSQAGIDVSSVIAMGVDTTLSHLTVRNTQATALGTTAGVSINESDTGDLADPTSITTVIHDVKIEMVSSNPDASKGISRAGPLRVERVKINVRNSDGSNRGIEALGTNTSPMIVTDSEIYATQGTGSATGVGILDQTSQGILLRNVYISGFPVALQKGNGTAQVIGSELTQTSGGSIITAASSATVRLFSSVVKSTGSFTELTAAQIYCNNTSKSDGTVLDADCL